MKRATLALITKGDKVLLGYKKKGEIGTGTLNGPGGRLDDGETLLQCVVRETKEELDIELDPQQLALVAILKFHVGDKPDFEVFVYRTSIFKGELRETADMIPAWYDIKNLPFERMLESDQKWFMKVLQLSPGKVLGARVYYKERAKGFERIEFYPLP